MPHIYKLDLCVCVCVCVPLHVVPYGNRGCSGGSLEVSILYVIDNEGIDTSQSYPYTEYVSGEVCK